ncbi:eukaryotic translation initiation factor, putative [Entamoeba histolytica HM-1:IMSS-B]|uniref:Eukaryotic translation initiation factor 3 subunit C N-terminal domain-containing protein n=6 Tax=Entamoeba histolytica TaxID=5759 RepID=C4M3N3_ENTH1|nr:hypothetical protein EHI_140610 [Entamoeba histolytica HM-1:IMSS]EMD48505.1 eukaryotic translation initiation factor, putative [Entamoeba histolytica KU27]EMH74460.1 eukaryotic translation initiation factor, putative [Entamoeba histolytica HM-1:IMSS-B]EMS16431.1 eukaryotic translation initiation factor 3 subunit 8 protein [Entamoeba histolytica HM-3:IMSS]ENY65199.1 translation initiation factor 3 subunit 8 n-terminus protein, putative [Entamoeba histolytica HM-1:IMSS-A]GAT95935.1 hypothetic|eukprot:XP_650648.1 hypothetical protein EHI_140610 [Entamoeba histolytica HM-1:IMSS]
MSRKNSNKKLQEEEEEIEDEEEEEVEEGVEDEEEEEDESDEEVDEKDDEEEVEEEEEEEEEDSVEEYEIHVYEENGEEVLFGDEEDEEWNPVVAEIAPAPNVDVTQTATSNFWKWLRKDWIESHGGLQAVINGGLYYGNDEIKKTSGTTETKEKVEVKKERVQVELFDKSIQGDEAIEKKHIEVIDKTKQKDRDELPMYLIWLEENASAQTLKFKIASDILSVSITNYGRSKRPGIGMDNEFLGTLLKTSERILEYLKNNEVIALLNDKSISNRISLSLSRIIEDEVHSLKEFTPSTEIYSNKMQEIVKFSNISLVVLAHLKNIAKSVNALANDFIDIFIDLALSILKAIHCFPNDTSFIYDNQPITLKNLVTALATVIFTESKDEESKQIAFLCHVAYLALNGDYSGASLLVSIPATLINSNIPFQILHNRAVALTALSAFKAKEYRLVYKLLHDLIQTNHVQVILGQANMKSETRSIPPHMFIDINALTAAFYFSAIASEEGDSPMNITAFKKLIENKSAAFIVPAQNISGHACAIHRAILEGDWVSAFERIDIIESQTTLKLDYSDIKNIIKTFAAKVYIKKYRDYYNDLTPEYFAELFQISEDAAKTLLN